MTFLNNLIIIHVVVNTDLASYNIWEHSYDSFSCSLLLGSCRIILCFRRGCVRIITLYFIQQGQETTAAWGDGGIQADEKYRKYLTRNTHRRFIKTI